MFLVFAPALTHTNKDKADIALDDAENNAHFAKKTQYGMDTNDDEYSIVFIFNKMNFVSRIVRTIDDQCTTIGLDSFTDCLNQQHSNNLVTSRRRTVKTISESHNSEIYTASQQAINQASALSQWKRIMLLVWIKIQLINSGFQINSDLQSIFIIFFDIH